MEYPSKHLQQAVDEIAKLPGIGKRSALRLALHLLRRNPEEVHQLAQSLASLIDEIQYCTSCHNISDLEICNICSDERRNKEVVCVVEDVRDVMAIENTGQFKGIYHVLGGLISPMDGIGPGDIKIASLVRKVSEGDVKEIVLALSSTMEGDTTNFYIFKKLQPLGINITTIARGLAVGDSLEYADEVTLGRSLTHRIPYEQVFGPKGN